MDNKRIIFLAQSGTSSNIIFNALNKRFGIYKCIIEEKESAKIFLRRRIKKLGIFHVLSQIAFRLVIITPLQIISKKRINQIIKANKLDVSNIPEITKANVNSINSVDTIKLLQQLKPDLIIVNGTRIISKKVLNSVNCKFINTHSGITPKYRGVHGMYWALANNDLANSGVTVHFVDEGIDTGNIIGQSVVLPSPNDNFTTYPLLQLSSGITLLEQAIENYFINAIQLKIAASESRLWYHPTIWEYLYNRITKKIK